MKILRWFAIFAGVIGLLVLASVSFRAMKERGIVGKLAKLRQMGHPTTMAELNAWYLAVPAESNAAVGLLAAMEMFPSVVPDKLPIFGEKSARVEPFEPWSEEAKSLASDYVSSNSAAYAAVSQALKLPGSRYPVAISSMALLPHLAQIKGAAQKLALSAHLGAEEGKREQATSAIVDGFLLARTLESEPIFIATLVRNACVGIAASACERVLNRLDLTDEQLARIQGQFAATLATNVLARGIAGETAFALDGFTMRPAQMAAMMGPLGGGGAAPPIGQTFGYTLYDWSGLRGADHECYLDAMIRLQEAANEEYPRRLTTASNIAFEVKGGTNAWPFVKSFSRALVPSLASGFGRDAHLTATLRCGLAALAVERFRIAHDGKLPDTLAEVVPRYLAAVPSDPYDGKPLRFLRLAKGFVVYSLGEDGDDDGGRPKKVGQKVAGDYDVTFRIER